MVGRSPPAVSSPKKSSTRLVLPIPGSPVNATIRPAPSLTWENARSRWARWASRPTVVRTIGTRGTAASNPGCEAVSSRTTSSAVGRRSGSFRNICCTRSSNARGMSGFSRVSGTGSSVRMLAMIPAEVAAVNGRCPAAISYSYDAKREDVSRGASSGASCLFGSDIRRGSSQRAPQRGSRGLRRHFRIRLFRPPCQTEVQDLHEPVVADHDVLGLHVSMDDAGRMRSGEGPRDLQSDLDQHLQRRSLAQHRSQRSPIDEFLDEKVIAGRRLADFMNDHDVGMI